MGIQFQPDIARQMLAANCGEVACSVAVAPFQALASARERCTSTSKADFVQEMADLDSAYILIRCRSSAERSIREYAASS